MVVRKPKYEWIADSAGGLVKHLATNVLRHGYRFYVSGEIKPSTDVDYFDTIMDRKFSFNVARTTRNRRKRAVGPDGAHLGLANIHYMRLDRVYLLISTAGKHPFFDAHSKVLTNSRGQIIGRESHFRDANRQPILIPFFEQGQRHCYSVRVVPEGALMKKCTWQDPNVREYEGKPRVRVQIARDEFLDLQADLLARAASARWSVEVLEAEIYTLPYLPFRSVRDQLWGLVRRMNRVRSQRGLPGRLDPFRCVRFRLPSMKTWVSQEVSREPERLAG